MELRLAVQLSRTGKFVVCAEPLPPLQRMTWRLGLLCLVLWARTGAALNNPPLFTVGVDSASFPELTEEDPSEPPLTLTYCH